MNEFKVGDRVEFTDADMHESMPHYYPAPGTIGTIVGDAFTIAPWVQWPNGSTSDDDIWSANVLHLRLVAEEVPDDT